MSKTILFVDSDDQAMKSLPASFSEGNTLLCATSYKAAHTMLKSMDGCHILIVELGLNGKNGIAFLCRMHRIYPHAVQMVLTDSRDFTKACETINNTEAFRLIEKPCDPKTLEGHINDALVRYEAEKAKRQSMRRTLLGSVRALVDILDLVNPEAMGFSKRIRERVVHTGRVMRFRPLWHLELAVMLSHIGCVALPSELLEKVDQGGPLSSEEKQIFGMHPNIASSLLANIEQMAPVAEIVRHQHDSIHEKQPVGARIIKVALDLDYMERRGRKPVETLKRMCKRETRYDIDVVKAMLTLFRPADKRSVREVGVEELEEGMVLAKDLVNQEGTKLLLRCQRITKASLMRLQKFHIALGIVDSIHVLTSEEADPLCGEVED